MGTEVCWDSSSYFISCDSLSAWSTAIGAGLTLATLIWTAWVSIRAIRAPAEKEAQDRSDATMEILRATRDAILILGETKGLRSGDGDARTFIKYRAFQLRSAFAYLLSKPNLTDGAIVVGAGACAILKAIEDHFEKYKTGESAMAVYIAGTSLDAAQSHADLVSERAIRVAQHAFNERWPGHIAQFKPIADHGLLQGLKLIEKRKPPQKVAHA